MALITRIGNEMQRGFTLMELVLVLFIVALLASLVAPVVTGSMQRARESALKEDLHVLRKAIDDYYADVGSYPSQLDDLVAKRYLRNIPHDPLSDQSDTWETTLDETQDNTGHKTTGVWDVHSKSDAQARDGTAYKDW